MFGAKVKGFSKNLDKGEKNVLDFSGNYCHNRRILFQ